ncbi:MAG: recombinase RecF, partial [Pseudoflavonifractor sp.]
NGCFKLARFRLFTQQVNGGLADCCEVLYGGVPYNSNLNSGARVNVGIDVISTLSAHYGVSVPLFIDNAESVTELQPLDTQVIRLVVSQKDLKLRCEHEN